MPKNKNGTFILFTWCKKLSEKPKLSFYDSDNFDADFKVCIRVQFESREAPDPFRIGGVHEPPRAAFQK